MIIRFQYRDEEYLRSWKVVPREGEVVKLRGVKYRCGRAVYCDKQDGDRFDETVMEIIVPLRVN